MTAFGDLLQGAIRRKSDELGEEFSFRDLDERSGVNYSYVAKLIKGTRQPSRAVVRALSDALRPHLPLEEAMIAAGYVPDGNIGILGRLAQFPGRALEEAERAARVRLLEGKPPEQDAADEPDEPGHNDQADHKPNP